MAASSAVLERIFKLWPLFIAVLILVFFFAPTNISMLGRVSKDCDVRRLSPGSTWSRLRGQENGLAVQTGVDRPLSYTVAMALLHYATSPTTPQQTRDEIKVTLNILNRRGPCNFLVYGLGHDSPLWEAFNHGGVTVFLEEDPKWIDIMKEKHPSLQAYHVKYSTKLSESDDLLNYTRANKEICSPKDDVLRSDCKMAIKSLPRLVYEIDWDVIMIDAPRGYFAEAPGRMGAIYSSAVMALSRERTASTDILLHDVERHVEKTWAEEFMCSKNRLEAVGKLWHFQVCGGGSERKADFCV